MNVHQQDQADAPAGDASEEDQPARVVGPELHEISDRRDGGEARATEKGVVLNAADGLDGFIGPI